MPSEKPSAYPARLRAATLFQRTIELLERKPAKEGRWTEEPAAFERRCTQDRAALLQDLKDAIYLAGRKP